MVLVSKIYMCFHTCNSSIHTYVDNNISKVMIITIIKGHCAIRRTLANQLCVPSVTGLLCCKSQIMFVQFELGKTRCVNSWKAEVNFPSLSIS